MTAPDRETLAAARRSLGTALAGLWCPQAAKGGGQMVSPDHCPVCRMLAAAETAHALLAGPLATPAAAPDEGLPRHADLAPPDVRLPARNAARRNGEGPFTTADIDCAIDVAFAAGLARATPPTAPGPEGEAVERVRAWLAEVERKAGPDVDRANLLLASNDAANLFNGDLRSLLAERDLLVRTLYGDALGRIATLMRERDEARATASAAAFPPVEVYPRDEVTSGPMRRAMDAFAAAPSLDSLLAPAPSPGSGEAP